MRRAFWLFAFLKEETYMRRVKMKRLAGALAFIICLGLISQGIFASSSAITGKINNLYDLVLGIIKAAGAIVLAWGVFEFAAGYQSHDSSQQTQSLKKVISGILMCGASTVISLVK